MAPCLNSLSALAFSKKKFSIRRIKGLSLVIIDKVGSLGTVVLGINPATVYDLED